MVVTRNGKAVAVLLAVEDDDELERLLLAYSPGGSPGSILDNRVESSRVESSRVKNRPQMDPAPRHVPPRPALSLSNGLAKGALRSTYRATFRKFLSPWTGKLL